MKILKTLFAIAIVSISCSKDNDEQQQTLQEPAKITNIYIGGSQKIAGKERATIWKNGVAKMLPSDPANNSRVNSVYVYNDVVYAVGYDYFGGAKVATLWKDDIRIILNTISSEAYSIAGFKDLVYIAGQVESKASLVAVKDDLTQEIKLNLLTNSIAKSVYVTNDGFVADGIYITGKNGSNAFTYKVTDGTTTQATNLSLSESIFVRGNDVFVAQNNTFLNSQTASLQKNGVPQNTIASNAAMYSVYGDEQNIYAVGAIYPNDPVNSRATIWENYISKQLSQLYSQANSVFVLDKNVYVAGFEYDSNTAHYKATLWTNGKIQTISTEDCQVKSVFVTVK